jgi:uncharacterized membrane protein
MPAEDTIDALSGHVHQNIESVVAFSQREQQKATLAQRRLDRVSAFIARPTYLFVLLSIVVLWIAGNSLARLSGSHVYDPPPFPLLQGLLTLAALFTTTVVLITQNRQAKLDSQRSHLDLQVNLLTEQKVTKLIHLLEELRRDLPMVKDRHDAVSAALQQPTDPAQVLSALEHADQSGPSPRSGPTSPRAGSA